MDPKLSPALAKRLAAYSAAAGLALVFTPAADAQVVYHDIDPDVVLEATRPADTLDLDFDSDGVTDLQFYGCYKSTFYVGVPCASSLRPRARAETAGRTSYQLYRLGLRVPEAGNMLNGVLGYSTADKCVGRLDVGNVVGPAGAGQVFLPAGVAASWTLRSSYTAEHCAFGGQEGYVGFRFVAGDGALHYGWLRMAANSHATLGIAYDYAYEATPGTPLRITRAIADGDVDRTVFPPEGGVLRYTVTVRSITDEPLPLDLWLSAERDGTPVATRFLGSGVLPPGATATRTVPVRVFPGTPPGTYDVAFRLLDPEGNLVAEEQFAITKEAGNAATDGPAFGVEPILGDLFAPADASVAPLTTHVLSAPAPNPATGQAALTLSVAEAQAVRVEVLDALGRRVAVLHDGPMAPGTPHRLVVDGAGLPAGVYAVRAVGETFTDVRTLTLVR